MLEFLSARFINSGVLLTILYFFNASWNMRITKASYFLINFLFDYNDVRAFKLFKWTAGYISKYETTKLKLAKT